VEPYQSYDVVGPYLADIKKQLQLSNKKEFETIKKKIDKLQFDLGKKKDLSTHFTESIVHIQQIKSHLDEIN
jgi:hypothetical protein